MEYLIIVCILLVIVAIVVSAFVAPIVEAQERDLHRQWHNKAEDDYYDEEDWYDYEES